MKETGKNSAGGSVAGLIGFVLIVFCAIMVLVFWSYSEGSGDDKCRVWDYGHGEQSHVYASQAEIDSFYKRVMAKAPNKRQNCQKYKKRILRAAEGYEYASDEEWNKRYKQIIAQEMKAWKANH